MEMQRVDRQIKNGIHSNVTDHLFAYCARSFSVMKLVSQRVHRPILMTKRGVLDSIERETLGRIKNSGIKDQSRDL